MFPPSKKKSDPLAEAQTFSLAPHPSILHLLTVFMLYMRLQTVTQQKQKCIVVTISYLMEPQQSSTRGRLNLRYPLTFCFFFIDSLLPMPRDCFLLPVFFCYPISQVLVGLNHLANKPNFSPMFEGSNNPAVSSSLKYTSSAASSLSCFCTFD